ncbi:ATP-binding protein [Rickettsiella endosymbiont of Xylota segnis]|uniref:ATP-binding protein n=1 Tax=Rickettsiella endosymbiont of Xylota segnis TaxID=3066238 RepID=UPI0030CA8BA6
MNRQTKASKNDEITKLQKIIDDQKVEISQLKNIIDDLPGDIYWKRCIGKELIYSGMNRTGTDSLHKMGFRWKINDIVGRTDDRLFDKETADTFIRNDWEVINEGVARTKEETAILPSGKKIIQLSTKRPLLDKEGHTIGIAGVSIDITELKETQSALQIALEKAKAASYAKTEFLENMRHDIRTPLSGIVGCAQIILSESNNSEKVTEYAKNLIQSSEALLNFLNRILEGIKVASGEMPLLKKKFDFNKNIQNIIDLNKSLAVKKNLTLTLKVDEEIPPYLIGDPERLQQIILELVTNALRFTQQGNIAVEAKLQKHEAQQDVIEIKVSDTGVGITKDKQDEIFTQFTRLTPAYQGIYTGLGLGLSIVKQLIDDLGGEVYVESQLQQGSTFTCIIPFQVPLVMNSIGVENTPLPMGSKLFKNTLESMPNIALNHQSLDVEQKRILLVEDDKLAAKIAQSILTELDCAIDIASDAKTALKNIQNKDYQLILMDIGLPDMDGIALAHRIRLQQWQRTDTTPIVGLTAHIDVENRQRCLDAGMNTVILKPLKKETAKELLKTFIPDNNVNQISSATKIRPISGAVLDIDAMKAILKDKELIKDCIHLMVLGLKKDLVELPELHKSANWQAIREIAHKRQGGASYCGAKRLEQACKQIDDYIREKGPNGQTNELYRQLIQEMDDAKTVCEDYIK